MICLLILSRIGQKNALVNPNISITDTMNRPNTDSFYITSSNASEIKTKIFNRKNSNGIVLMVIPHKLLKLFLTVSEPIMCVFNKSFLTVVFPDSLKHAKITSVYKADDKLLINNYRSI